MRVKNTRVESRENHHCLKFSLVISAGYLTDHRKSPGQKISQQRIFSFPRMHVLNFITPNPRVGFSLLDEQVMNPLHGWRCPQLVSNCEIAHKLFRVGSADACSKAVSRLRTKSDDYWFACKSHLRGVGKNDGV